MFFTFIFFRFETFFPILSVGVYVGISSLKEYGQGETFKP